MQNGKNNDDFWDLGDFKSRKQLNAEADRKPSELYQGVPQGIRSFPANRTSAVEINDTRVDIGAKKLDESETVITKFVPPHSNATITKKNIIFSYEPQNPLIKSVTLFSEREGDELFVSDNLFIRERRAFLDRTATFKEYVPFYSYAPRYSQLNKAQLNYYLWWRQNARNGNLMKTDESYIMLYAYELAATGNGEDKEEALRMLCSIITLFSSKELGIAYKIMIRDIIADFCLIHELPSPIGMLLDLERAVLFGSFLPEFFTDLSQAREHCAPVISSMSLYDYRRSKCYSEATAETFKHGIAGALNAVMNNDDAFSSITSFTRGVYGSVSLERHPFVRMVNIVNKNVKLEVEYYSLDNIKSAVTDIVRYSENKIRDHLGIRSKINVLTVNPLARQAIDVFFAENMPAQKYIDRRRKDARDVEQEMHEYDKLYDVPKVEISPERAMEIEQESWDTTKKLTEAFEDDQEISTEQREPVIIEVSAEKETLPTDTKTAELPNESNAPQGDGLYAQLYSSLGSLASFVNLCKGASLIDQRKFASAHGTTTDELADKINECAVELFGDIILENDGSAYTIIEDYLFLFN